MTEPTVADDVYCKKCHSHKLWIDKVKDIDGETVFIVCKDCGFDWEAKDGDIEYER